MTTFEARPQKSRPCSQQPAPETGASYEPCPAPGGHKTPKIRGFAAPVGGCKLMQPRVRSISTVPLAKTARGWAGGKGGMGWEQAVAYQKARAEAEERERVAAWEARVGSKRPVAHGPARCLERSFSTAIQSSYQTSASSSTSYQGKHGACRCTYTNARP